MLSDLSNLPLLQRLQTHVDILAELIGERNTIRPANLDAARGYLACRIEQLGGRLIEQRFATSQREGVNLELLLEGKQPARGTVVVGAHYDSAPGTPGADDNASAVAILLEITRELIKTRSKRRVRVVFYDCEEPPHFNLGQMGSQHHAAQLKQSGERVDGMICLESLGYFPLDSQGSPYLPLPLRWLNRVFGQRYVVVVSDIRSVSFGARFVARFATSGLFPFVPAALPVKWVPDIALSDHRGYWEQGFKALMVTDTAHLRNPNYHQATDRLATLDLPRMTRLCTQLTRTIRRMCG